MQADNQIEQNRKHFYELLLVYVCKLQEIQERKKFEFVEPVSRILKTYLKENKFYNRKQVKVDLKTNITILLCAVYVLLLFY